MVVSVDRVARRYEDIVQNQPISVDMPAFEASDIKVIYGIAALEAVQGTDYTVALAEDFDTFTVTPTATLYNKIQALITADSDEEDAITVRRELDMLTDATAAGVRHTPFTAKEFDRNAMRDQQLKDRMERSVGLSETFAEPYFDLTVYETPPDTSDSPVMVFRSNGGLGPGPSSDQIADAQENGQAVNDFIETYVDDPPNYEQQYRDAVGSTLTGEGGSDFTSIYLGALL